MASRWATKGLVAVLDTSVLVAARLSKARSASPNRLIVQAAGLLYDSFTSPLICREVESVLARPRFGIPQEETRLWFGVFLRSSRQVDPAWAPGDFTSVIRDFKDNPILRTAFAVPYHEEGAVCYELAQKSHGCYVVRLDNHFAEGWTVYGWTFIRTDSFWRIVQSRA